MLQLREGVKLKKIDYSKTPLEYTLTPYEMLMEDIRSRRYGLTLELGISCILWDKLGLFLILTFGD